MVMRISMAMVVFVLYLTTCSLRVAGGADSMAEARHMAEGYLKAMTAECGGSQYLKEDGQILEYRGKLYVSDLHEPPYSDRSQGIEWSGAFEIYAESGRMYSEGAWSPWHRHGPDVEDAVMIGVTRKQGAWTTSGLERVSCGEIPVARAAASRGPRWLFSDSDSRYLTERELAGLSSDELWVARNEIYARRGFIFKTARGKAYAQSLGSAYQPLTENPKFNKFEEKNVQLIQSVEKRRK